MPDPSTNDPNDQAPRQQYNEPALRRRRPPIQVRPLGYAPVDPESSREPLSSQFVFGFFFPLLYCIPVGLLAASLPRELGPLAGWAALGGFLALVVLIRVRSGWKAFIPGVLASVLGLPLLLLGICALVLKTKG